MIKNVHFLAFDYGDVSRKKIDYVLLYCDSIPETAAEWAKIIGSKTNIPIHTKYPTIFDRSVAERFNAT